MSGVLSDQEVENIVMALARGQARFTEKEAEKVVDWAIDLRVGEAMLQLVLQGRCALLIDQAGEVNLVEAEGHVK